MTSIVDAIVIGAGPAGSAAAITLASRGFSTCLVDRASFPRPKVCGDGLTPRALATLKRLGVWHRLEPHALSVNSIRTIDLRSGEKWSGPLPSRLTSRMDRGAVVRRDVLDHLLCQRAVEAGAVFGGGIVVERVEEVRPGRCIVEGVANGSGWRREARSIVLAEGAGGRLGAAIGVPPPRLHGIAIRQYWRLSGLLPVFTICVPIECEQRPYAGYGWIFPVSDRLANVGVGLYGSRDGGQLRLAYRTFLERLKRIDPDWKTAEPCGAAQGGSLQTGRTATELVRGRIVLAGDAAGVTNPFTGEGIAQALESGQLMACSVMEDLVSPGCLAKQVALRTTQTFPETSRLVEHLPWLAARSASFVPEFWRAVSPPVAVIAKAVRRVALEEDLQSTATMNTSVERTWKLLTMSISEDSPILVSLLQAMRHESESKVDLALLIFWNGFRSTEVPAETDSIGQLLLLASLICVMARSDCGAPGVSRSRDANDSTSWAVNAMTLGAVDMIVAHFFAHAARLSATVSAQCARLLSQAIRSLPVPGNAPNDSKRMKMSLRALALGFREAARSCVATAA